MTTKSIASERAKLTGSLMAVLSAALLAGCIDQPTEPGREVLTATRPNANAVYTEPWFGNEFYEVLDENGDKIWHTEADLPLQGGYFTLANDQTDNPAGLQACFLFPDGNTFNLFCPPVDIGCKADRCFDGDDVCNNMYKLYPFAHVLTTAACLEFRKAASGGRFHTGDRVQLVAAPTAPGGRVFKGWHIKLDNIAADPYPCDEGQTSLTCTLTADQDYADPFGFTNVKVIYGPPDDASAPTITITTPAANSSYTLGQSVLADYECVEETGGSGIASCTGPVTDGVAINTATVGAQAFKVDAADNATNASTLTAPYSVTYNFSGFAAPIDGGNVLNKATAGKTIPLKWRLLDANGNPITTLTSVNVTVATLACSAGATTDAVEEYSTGSSGLQNVGNGFYQYNWKTPANYAKSCKTLHLDMGEGITRTAKFEFTK